MNWLETIIRARPKAREQTRQMPVYQVILENDDYHSFPFVVEVLCKAMLYTQQRSYVLTHEAHTTGRAVVWSGAKEVAELKVDRIRSFAEIRDSDGTPLGPLTCSIEPAE